MTPLSKEMGWDLHGVGVATWKSYSNPVEKRYGVALWYRVTDW